MTAWMDRPDQLDGDAATRWAWQSRRETHTPLASIDCRFLSHSKLYDKSTTHGTYAADLQSVADRSPTKNGQLD